MGNKENEPSKPSQSSGADKSKNNSVVKQKTRDVVWRRISVKAETDTLRTSKIVCLLSNHQSPNQMIQVVTNSVSSCAQQFRTTFLPTSVQSRSKFDRLACFLVRSCLEYRLPTRPVHESLR